MCRRFGSAASKVTCSILSNFKEETAEIAFIHKEGASAVELPCRTADVNFA